MLFDAPAETYPYNMKILGTDNENWLVIYSCFPIIDDVFGIDLIWLMGKRPFLEAKYIDVMESVIREQLPWYPIWMMMRTIHFWCWERY